VAQVLLFLNCKCFSVSAFHQSISATLHCYKAHYCNISAPLVLKSTSINQGNILRVHPPHCGATNKTFFPLKIYALPSCLPELHLASWRTSKFKGTGLGSCTKQIKLKGRNCIGIFSISNALNMYLFHYFKKDCMQRKLQLLLCMSLF
jgi:hypothetical protein